MKKHLFLFLFLLANLITNAQEFYADLDSDKPAVNNTSQSGEVYFLRSTGYAGCAISYKAFLDDKLTSRINNNRFSSHTVQTGKHNYSVQIYGKRKKAKLATKTIEVNPGEKKYILLVQQSTFWKVTIHAVEISEASALELMENMKVDKHYQ